MGNEAKGFEYKKFATPRIIGGIAIVVIVLWALSIIFRTSEGPTFRDRAAGHDAPAVRTLPESGAAGPATRSGHGSADGHTDEGSQGATTRAMTTSHGDDRTKPEGAAPGHGAPAREETAQTHASAAGEGTAARQTAGRHAAPAGPRDGAPASPSTDPAHGSTAGTGTTAHQTADSHARPADTAAATHESASAGQAHPQSDAGGSHGQPIAQHGAASHPSAAPPVHKPMPKGVAFVEATIQPLRFELEERWWGWRPNDLVDITDNINRFQLGVLEVTRRTAVALGERITRHGTTDAFDENLENAMNWFMVKATSYWFPSAESKYRDGLEELEIYLEKLKAGEATFYTRTDNLIPLLASLEDLLGSCDENLVKQFNEDGTPVSFFAVDNYFYYTQGVASAMVSILEAVHHDFLLTLESRNGTELLHHAIESCQWAAQLDPWIVLDRNLSSVFANHRANMAAPISHARFYIGQLIKTLST